MTYSDKLKELVYSNKKCVSVRDVAHQFNVHVSEARRILEDFLAEHKEDKKLSGVYVVSGTSKDSCDSYKSYKLAYAEANELEEIKKDFATVDSCSLFSVAEKDVEPVIEDVDQPPILDIADISKYQKLTYILNDDIKLREDRVEKMKLILGLQKNNEEPKVKEVKKENVTELAKPKKELINGSNKKSTNNKNKNNKKQTKLAGFDSKKVKTEKPEPEPEPMVDPFSEEEEEEEDKEEKIEKVEKVEEKEKEPEIVKKERSPSPPPSPPVIKDEPMEEEPVQKVSKSKKRKRVRVFDSDEEDEETIALKILADSPTDDDKPVKKSKKGSKPSQPMETRTISEEYTDEDGYTQVKLVKKLVPVKKDDDEENVNSNKSTKVKTEKSVDKKKKAEVETEDEETKPKPKKLSKAAAAKKGQVSITNFFKPTAKD